MKLFPEPLDHVVDLSFRRAVKQLHRDGFIGESKRASLMSDSWIRAMGELLDKVKDQLSTMGKWSTHCDICKQFRLMILTAEYNNRTKRSK